MRKISLTFLGLLISWMSFAQISWLYDLKSAQAVALSRNQLIVVDFWATWCRPCLEMDKFLWQSPEMADLADQFVALKIDIDQHRALALEYDAVSIPTVLILSPSGDIIWRKVGFSSASSYLETLGSIPKDLKLLSQNMAAQMRQADESVVLNYNIAIGYQVAAIATDNDEIKKSLLDLSTTYLRKVYKKDESEKLSNLAQLNEAMNYALADEAKKGLRKLEKIESSRFDAQSKELAKFIQAFCYKCEGNDLLVEKLKAEISNPQFLQALNK